MNWLFFFFLLWLFFLLALFLSTQSSLLCCCHSNSMTIAIIALGLLMELESTLYLGLEIMVLVRIMCFWRAKRHCFSSTRSDTNSFSRLSISQPFVIYLLIINFEFSLIYNEWYEYISILVFILDWLSYSFFFVIVTYAYRDDVTILYNIIIYY